MALKVRELLQPAAKERQREAGQQFGKGAKVSADLREAIAPPPVAPSPPSTPAEHRKSTAQAAKAVGASPRAVEQAARVAKVAPDLLPQVQAGTLSHPTLIAMPGTPRPGRLVAAMARSEQLRPLIEPLIAEGLGRRQISQRLAEEHGIVTRNGRPINPADVRIHLRRLGLASAYETGELSTASDAYREAKRQGMARAAAAGRNPGRHPAVDAARQRRSEAAAAWRQAITPTLQALAAAGCSQPQMLERLAAAGITSADGKPINRCMLGRTCALLGITTLRSGPRRRKAAEAAAEAT